MKKLLFTLSIAVASYFSSFAQWSTPATDIYNTNSGNVGIGTANPLYKLHTVTTGNTNYVSSFLYGDYYGTMVGVNTTSPSYYAFNVASGIAANSSGGNSIFTVRADGNVGIGTTSPGSKLYIAGGGRNGLMIDGSLDGTATSKYLSFWQGSGAVGIDPIGTGIIYLGYDQPSDVRFGGSPYNGVWQANGNVGIGTTSPIGKFDVRGNAFIGTNDLSIGSVGSFVQIDQGASTGNTYTQIRAFSNGGNAVNNLILQNSGGNVGIGTTDPQGYKLAVNGSAIAESVTVKLHGSWPDYVFKPKYNLLSLAEVKTYIDKNQHLPDMPSEAEVKESGINLGEIVRVQTKKIEELTLYLIEQQKQIEDLKILVTNNTKKQ